MIRTVKRVLPLLLLAAAVGAGVAGAAGPTLKNMTLREGDLPVGFDQDFSHKLPRSQLIKIQGATTTGYRGGWQREFTRLQGVDSAVVTSTVVRYDTSDHAHTAVRASWKHILGHTGAKRLAVGRALGYEARAIAYQETVGTLYAVIWRYRNVNGTVFVAGLKSLGVTLEMATKLAVKQERHIRAEL